MELTGLTLQQVLTTLAIVGGIVVVLYLLKLRRRRVEVPFVKLWEKILAEKQSTRLFSQLKRLISLLIALAIAAMLAFALGDPRYAGATAQGRTLVLLFDASASMQATDGPEGKSRFEQAKDRARELIEALGPQDRALLAQMDATTTPLTPLTGDSRALIEALDELEVRDVAASFSAGMRFALDVLRGESKPEIVVLSDGKIGNPGIDAERAADAQVRLSYVKIGQRDGNVAISAFAVRRYPLDKSQSEVLVELWNPSQEDRNVELTLVGDGQPVDVQRLAVKKGERIRRFFRNVSGVDTTLEARLSIPGGGHDDLPADDRAYARLPERRRARILCVSRGNLYLQAALLLDEYLDVVEVTPENYPAEGRFDVTIFDGWLPPSQPDTNAIYIYPSLEEPPENAPGPLQVEGVFDRPFFDRLDRRHPLLRFTALADVNVGRAWKVRAEPADQVAAADERGPLLVSGARNGRRFVAFTFDVRASDLPLRVAWPLLLLHSIDWFVQEDAGYVSSYRTGDTWHIPVPAGTTTAMIVDPEGIEHEAPVVEGRAVYAGLDTGFYKVRTQQGEDVFAANLGESQESDILPATGIGVGERRAGRPSRGSFGARKELWMYLIIAVMLVLAAEWFTYHRRWTV